MNTNALHNLPADLKALPQWVVWRMTRRGNDKPTKVPHQAGGGLAKSTDPTTWTTHAGAVEAAPRFNGVGFVLADSDPFACIDLDHSIGEGGELLDWARPFVERFPGTFVELSPSGTGLHIWIRAALPGGKGKNGRGFGPDKSGGVEMYDRGRYMTMTGQTWNGSPLVIVEHQAAAEALIADLTGGKASRGLLKAQAPQAAAPAMTTGETRKPDPSPAKVGRDRVKGSEANAGGKITTLS